MKKTFYVIILISLMMLCISCDSSTSSDNKTTFSGIVKLIDLEGNETVSDEVTVAIFQKDEADISWDYRLEKPILVTKTDNTGQFSYKANKTDSYNVVFLQEGYSIKEIEQNKLTDIIKLYKNIEIGGTIINPVELNGTSDLVITSNTDFVNNGSLSILSNSKIRINSGVKVTFYGNISFNSPVIITSNDKIYSFDNEQVAEFMSFEISPLATIQNDIIANVNCSFATNGFIVQNDNIEIKDCSFVNSANGLYILNSDGHNISNIFAQNITNPSMGGIYLDLVNNSTISRCQLRNNHNGIKVKEVNNININNCLFENNNSGYLSYQSVGSIVNNEFNNNRYCLELLANRGSGVLNIGYNIMADSDIGVYQHEAGSWNTFNTMLINNNNFIDIPVFIKYDSSGISRAIDATNNYFDGLASESNILNKIIDTSLQEELFIDVNVVPFKTKPIATAGIIQE